MHYSVFFSGKSLQKITFATFASSLIPPKKLVLSNDAKLMIEAGTFSTEQSQLKNAGSEMRRWEKKIQVHQQTIIESSTWHPRKLTSWIPKVMEVDGSDDFPFQGWVIFRWTSRLSSRGVLSVAPSQ